ncbi:MAG: Gfo/Idh/MocA family oxidoreductase [Prevotella sp.]|nr:Gfo/Idh/MocA family oxidoreductase [Prevotella sp.]
MDLNNNVACLPVRMVAIGAGNRMRTYMKYVREHSNEARLVAVIEPDEVRRNDMADQFGLPAEARFSDYEEYFKAVDNLSSVQGKAAEGVAGVFPLNDALRASVAIIATPEDHHFQPTLMAIRRGMHVLLEKPVAQRYEECEQLASEAREHGVYIGVCHVLRYMPCFRKVREVVASGKLGKVVSVRHTERVGIDRQAHSYVRGVFSDSRKANPMFLSKCCHDIDFLLWVVQSPARRVSSFGSLKWFRAENAPEGSARRCVDCKVEPTCPYSAVDLYWRRREWISNFDVPAGKSLDEVLQDELNEGSFGRCVYHCSNDVVDHQTCIIELADQTTISIDMTAFTRDDFRSTTICLTEGEVYCDESKVVVKHFRKGTEEVFDFTESMAAPYHGGADFLLLDDFLKAVSGRTDHLSSSIDEALQSHRLCFEAEQSRLTGQVREL